MNTPGKIDQKLEKLLDDEGLRYDYMEDCLLIYGDMPADMFSNVVRRFDMHAVICLALQSNAGATMVIGNSSSLDALKESFAFKEIARNYWANKLNKLSGKGDAEFYSKLPENVRNWFETGHHGASSLTLMNMTLGKELEFHDEDDHYDDYPIDVYDFNRCLKLVEAVPEIREHLPEMRKLSKEWMHVIENFDSLASQIKEVQKDNLPLFLIKDEFKESIDIRPKRQMY